MVVIGFKRCDAVGPPEAFHDHLVGKDLGEGGGGVLHVGVPQYAVAGNARPSRMPGACRRTTKGGVGCSGELAKKLPSLPRVGGNSLVCPPAILE